MTGIPVASSSSTVDETAADEVLCLLRGVRTTSGISLPFEVGTADLPQAAELPLITDLPLTTVATGCLPLHVDWRLSSSSSSSS